MQLIDQIQNCITGVLIVNYYTHRIGDYLRSAGHLTMLEHGAYRQLLDRYLSTEQPIPVDHVYRITHARTTGERNAVDAVIGEFFRFENDTYINDWAEKTIAETQKIIERNRINGSKPKRQNTHINQQKEKLSGFDFVTPVATQNEVSHTPTPTSHSPTTHTADTIAIVCAELQKLGFTAKRTTELISLINAGATCDDFVAAAAIAATRGKDFAYTCGIVKRKLDDTSRAIEQRNRFTDAEIIKAARPGETTAQVISRLSGKSLEQFARRGESFEQALLRSKESVK